MIEGVREQRVRKREGMNRTGLEFDAKGSLFPAFDVAIALVYTAGHVKRY